LWAFYLFFDVFITTNHDRDTVRVWFGRICRAYKENVLQSPGISRKFQLYFPKQSTRNSSDFTLLFGLCSSGLQTRADLYTDIDISYEHAHSIFTFEVSLKMEAICSDETSVSAYKTTFYRNRQNHTQTNHRRENLETYTSIILIRYKDQCNFETGQWTKPKTLNNS
jgi:hypothetical protein